MAEEASRSTDSLSTIRSGSISRRNSLPLFRSDLGKDVPGYLRASTGSCHDHCKYGRREMCEVMQKQPSIKRHVAARELKASDKSQLGQNVPSKIRKPQILPSSKTPEVPRDKDAVTKSSESFPKFVKSKLLKERSTSKKSTADSGNEELKGEQESVPWSGNLRDAKTNSRNYEGGNVTKFANGSSTTATMKLNAKSKPPLFPAPPKITARVKPLSSSSPPRARPVMKARPQSSPKKLKPVSIRVNASSSPTKSRLVKLRVKSSSSPTKSRPVSLRVNSSSSPIILKPTSLKVNSSSSPGSFKLMHATSKISPPSISPRSVSGRKSVIIRSQNVKTGKSSKVRVTETVATQRGPDFKDVAHSEKEELQQQNLVETQIDIKNGLQQENLVETQIDGKKELQGENQVEEQIDEKKEVFEKNEEDLSCETELQNQEFSESYDDEATEKTLNVIKTDAGNNTQSAPNAEDEIPDMQSLASESPRLTPSSPISVTDSNMTNEPEECLMELANSDTSVPCPDQEALDIEPLLSLSSEILPESQSSIVASNESILHEVSVDGSIHTDATVPLADQEALDKEPMPCLRPEILHESQSSIVASNEVSVDGSIHQDAIVPLADQEPLDNEPMPCLSTDISHESQSSIVASNEVSMDSSIHTDTTVPLSDQEALVIEPLPSLSPEILPEYQSSIVASNEASLYEVSVDGSVYTDSDEGYSSYEDEHLVEGENLKGEIDNIKVKKKSIIVTSQENGNDPVKLRFKRGRVIDITHENQSPRRLKFRRGRVLDEKTVNDLIRKRSHKITEATQVDVTTENNSSSVVLRHQDTQDKKDAQVLFNNVIEETANKLVEKRKSMVKALVGAFETVISLQDGKPATAQQEQ